MLLRYFLLPLSAALLACIPALTQPAAPSQPQCSICFFGPDNLVFDGAGNAYVADNDHRGQYRVLKITPDGRVAADWRPFAAAAKDGGPEGIALSEEGHLFVTDAAARQVLELSASGTVLRRISRDFLDLGHLALAPGGELYVAEGGANRVRKISAGEELLATWQRSPGTRADQWNRPEAIALRPDGTLLVEDWGNRRVLVLSPQGKTLATWGKDGTGPGEFKNSAGLFADRFGKSYVADIQLHRIQVFGRNGDLLQTIANSGEHQIFAEGPSSVAVDNSGNVYAADGLSIVKVSSDGRVLARWK